MSYIRSTSNPEGLYIWWDVSGKMAFARGKTLFYYYSAKKFQEFMGEFIKNGEDFPFSLNGIEVWEDATRNYKICIAIPSEGKIRRLYMWLVTWEHIVNNFKRRR